MKYSDSNYRKKHKKKSKFESRITAFANTLFFSISLPILLYLPTYSSLSPYLFFSLSLPTFPHALLSEIPYINDIDSPDRAFSAIQNLGKAISWMYCISECSACGTVDREREKNSGVEIRNFVHAELFPENNQRTLLYTSTAYVVLSKPF